MILLFTIKSHINCIATHYQMRWHWLHTFLCRRQIIFSLQVFFISCSVNVNLLNIILRCHDNSRWQIQNKAKKCWSYKDDRNCGRGKHTFDFPNICYLITLLREGRHSEKKCVYIKYSIVQIALKQWSIFIVRLI